MSKKVPLIVDSREMKGRQYLVDKKHMASKLPEKTFKKKEPEKVSIIVPLEVDTEYVPMPIDYFLKEEKVKKRLGVTVQIKGVHESEGIIYAHNDLEQIVQEITHGDE